MQAASALQPTSRQTGGTPKNKSISRTHSWEIRQMLLFFDYCIRFATYVNALAGYALRWNGSASTHSISIMALPIGPSTGFNCSQGPL